MKRLTLILFFVAALALAAGAAFGEEVKLQSKARLGDYLTDSSGMTLYYFKNDSSGKSVCYGGCLKNWPEFYASKVTPPKGVDAKDFGTITRDDGKKQTTYRGYPLYYFAGDTKAGDTNGQGKGDVWYVVDPARFMTQKAPSY